jgi:hypothetical protein
MSEIIVTPELEEGVVQNAAVLMRGDGGPAHGPVARPESSSRSNGIDLRGWLVRRGRDGKHRSYDIGSHARHSGPFVSAVCR